MIKGIQEVSLDSKKDKIEGISFTRACCAIGIIIYHYFCHSNSSFSFLYTSANSDWGSLFVTVFFAISGAVLYYNYPQNFSLKLFYYKRWKSIFPAFYMCFLFFFLKNVFAFHAVFYAGRLPILFSLFGMDGYFLYRFPNYYLVGEWFLGAIIMLYLMYPALSLVINKNQFIIPVLLITGYVWMLGTDFFIVDNFRNMITCTASFYFGMLAIRYKELFFKNKIIGIASFFILVFLCCVRLPQFVFIYQIQGFALMTVLIQVGNMIMNTKVKPVFSEISKLSLCIFLFQHIIILDMQGVSNPHEWYKVLLVLTATIILTLICSKILQIVVDSILQSKLFNRIELRFLKNNI